MDVWPAFRPLDVHSTTAEIHEFLDAPSPKGSWWHRPSHSRLDAEGSPRRAEGTSWVKEVNARGVEKNEAADLKALRDYVDELRQERDAFKLRLRKVEDLVLASEDRSYLYGDDWAIGGNIKPVSERSHKQENVWQAPAQKEHGVQCQIYEFHNNDEKQEDGDDERRIGEDTKPVLASARQAENLRRMEYHEQFHVEEFDKYDDDDDDDDEDDNYVDYRTNEQRYVFPVDQGKLARADIAEEVEEMDVGQAPIFSDEDAAMVLRTNLSDLTTSLNVVDKEAGGDLVLAAICGEDFDAQGHDPSTSVVDASGHLGESGERAMQKQQRADFATSILFNHFAALGSHPALAQILATTPGEAVALPLPADLEEAVAVVVDAIHPALAWLDEGAFTREGGDAVDSTLIERLGAGGCHASLVRALEPCPGDAVFLPLPTDLVEAIALVVDAREGRQESSPVPSHLVCLAAGDRFGALARALMPLTDQSMHLPLPADLAKAIALAVDEGAALVAHDSHREAAVHQLPNGFEELPRSLVGKTKPPYLSSWDGEAASDVIDSSAAPAASASRKLANEAVMNLASSSKSIDFGMRSGKESSGGDLDQRFRFLMESMTRSLVTSRAN